jgi:hypothetical protein
MDALWILLPCLAKRLLFPFQALFAFGICSCSHRFLLATHRGCILVHVISWVLRLSWLRLLHFPSLWGDPLVEKNAIRYSTLALSIPVRGFFWWRRVQSDIRYSALPYYGILRLKCRVQLLDSSMVRSKDALLAWALMSFLWKCTTNSGSMVGLAVAPLCSTSDNNDNDLLDFQKKGLLCMSLICLTWKSNELVHEDDLK